MLAYSIYNIGLGILPAENGVKVEISKNYAVYIHFQINI